MNYVLVQFTSPEVFAQQAYMVSSGGQVTGFTDMNGNPLIPPRICEYQVTDAYPEKPSWAA